MRLLHNPVLPALLMLPGFLLSAASADEHGDIRPQTTYVAEYDSAPWHGAYQQPAPLQPGSGGCLGGHRRHSGLGAGVPRFRWGYFGACPRPQAVFHSGYYGDYAQWGVRW